MKILKKYRSKGCAKTVSNFRKRFVFFGQNSGLHGLNHLFGKNVIFLARLFWLAVLVASIVCLYLLLVPVIQNEGKIYFAPDTRYLEWTTTFPAVTVCEQTNTKLAQRRFTELYPDLLKPLSYTHQRYLTELLFGRGSCSRDLCSPCGVLVPCDVPWRDVIENVHKKCEEILSDCAYNGIEFPCCKMFVVTDSERGPCFTFNALQNVEFTKEPLFAVNRTTGPGLLTFHVLSDADVALHSNEELATNSLSEKLKFQLRLQNTNKFDILFSVVEIENEVAISDEAIDDRKCRFINEIPDDMYHTYSVYSHGACVLAENTEHVSEHCGCVSPLRDLSYMKYFCNYTGMVCVTEHEVLKNKLVIEHEDEEEGCLPSCVESELYIKHFSKSFLPDYTGAGMAVKIEMDALPTLRYQRNLLRTDLDFVVTVGGMAGLFFGASVLSVIEIFYLLMRKPNNWFYNVF